MQTIPGGTYQPRQQTTPGTGPCCMPSPAMSAYVHLALSFVALIGFADVIVTVNAQGEIIELHYELVEEQPSGTFIGNVVRDANLTSLYGADVTNNGRIRFRFMRQPSTLELVISPSTGEVRTGRGRVDRESVCAPRSDTCLVRADVVVQPVDYFRIIRLTVTIIDVNDGAPVFPDSSLITFDVLESSTAGTSVLLPEAVDPDSPPYSVASYRVVSSSPAVNGKFKLTEYHARDGTLRAKLVVVGSLDRETVDRHQITVVAVDGGTPPKTGSVEVVINILDANDNSPVFERDSYDVVIAENAPRMTSLVQVRAVDRDVGLNGHVTYSWSEQSAAVYGELFAVDAESGKVDVIGNIDCDHSSTSFQLIVIARDSGPDAVPSSVPINVDVTDANDNAPEVVSIDSFVVVPTSSSSRSGVDAVVLENGKAKTFIAHLTITDADSGDNGRFNCVLLTDKDSDKFHLKRIYDTEFQIVTSVPLDRETADLYNVTVECTDLGIPPQTARRVVKIAVDDVNDHAPSFKRKRYVSELFENNYIGAVVVQVTAVDADLGNNSQLTYSLSGPGSELFTIDPRSGLITAAATLDREISPQISFRAIAADSGSTSLVGSALVVVNVQDVNDNRPEFVMAAPSASEYTFEVTENQPAGIVIGQISATDADSGPNQSVEYRLLKVISGDTHGEIRGGLAFDVDPITGFLKTGQPLDREQADKHLLTVIAVDRGVPPMSSTAVVIVNVLDVNDNAPEFDFPPSTSGNQEPVSVSTAVRRGTAIAQLVARDADLGVNSRIAYGSDDTSVPFRVDPDTGQVLVDGDLSQSNGKHFKFIVKAADYRGLSTSTMMHIVVNASYPVASIEDYPAASTATYSGLFVGYTFVSDFHLTAVICLAVGSGIVTVVLVIAIAIVRRRRGCCCGNRKRGHGSRQYNCRTAASLRLNQTATTSPVCMMATSVRNGSQGYHSPDAVGYSVVDATSRNASTFTNACSGSIEDTTGSGSLIGYGMKSVMANDTGSCCGYCAISGGSGDCDRCGSQQRLLHSCTTLSSNGDQTKNKTQQLPSVRYTSATLRPSNSSRPIYAFNTMHQFQHQHGHSPASETDCNQHTTATELEVRHLLRRLQTVPDTDDAASEQSHCEGSNTDSGRGASDDGEIAVTSCGILKNNLPEIRFHGDKCFHYSKCHEMVATTNRPFMATSTFQPDHVVSCASNEMANHGSRSLRSPLITETALDDEDEATTTSGSYIVDARELCNEIDKTFFTGNV